MRETYSKFLKFLIIKPHITEIDRLHLVSYLLLQERTTEAIDEFAKV